jgi:hypothetical protein
MLVILQATGDAHRRCSQPASAPSESRRALMDTARHRTITVQQHAESLYSRASVNRSAQPSPVRCARVFSNLPTAWCASARAARRRHPSVIVPYHGWSSSSPK